MKYTTKQEGEFFRIFAEINFGNIQAGQKGGLIKSESNLSQEGDCWVFCDAQVSDDARVFGSARVFGDARVSGSARVFGSAQVFVDARVFGSAQVFGDAQVFGSARVAGSAQVFGSARVSGSARVVGAAQVSGDAQVVVIGPYGEHSRYITLTHNQVSAGCFLGTPEEFITAVREKYGPDCGDYARIINILQNLMPTA